MGWKPTPSASDTDAIHDNVAAEISAIAEKVAPVDADLLVMEDSAAANAKKRVQLGNLPGAASIPQWIEYLAARQAGETPHADDDFFDDAALSGTVQTVSGTAVWAELYDTLGVKFDDQNAADAAARLWALTPSDPPVTVETAVTMILPDQDFTLVAVCFTDGTITSSNVAAARCYVTASGLGKYNVAAGTLTSVDTTVNTDVAQTEAPFPTGPLFLRIVWSAANTFEAAFAIRPGGPWTDFGTTSIAKTMTPTHYGVYVTTYAGAEEGLAAFEYLRVNESDLSA